MPYKNNFYKMLVGSNPQVAISGAVAYTAQASLAAFEASAAQGELGVFDSDTGLLVSGAGAASLTENILFAVMRDGAIERTTSFQIGQCTLTRTVYSAPVKQVSTITVGKGGFASLVLGDITYTAVNQGVGGNAITVTNVVAGNNTALSVAVAGSAITVNLATNGGGAATSTATQVQAAVAASGPASALVTSAVTGTGATVQAAHAAANLAGATAGTAVANNQTFDIAILETTPGNQPFPTYEYMYVATAVDTIDTVITNLVNQINSTANIANKNRDLIVTATYVAATGIITVTAINFGVSFRLLVKYDLANTIGATIAYPTPMHLGSGFTQQVQLFQDAGDIYKGVTTNYPLQGSNPADYGKPSDMTIPAMGYNIYTITGFKADTAKTPQREQFFHRTMYIFVPNSGTTPEVQVKAILGL